MTVKVFILIASRFDEAAVIACLYQLREVGLGVHLVGLIPGPLSGQQGLSVNPDLALSTLVNEKVLAGKRPLFIIPGGAENASLLFSDPRVHEVCETAVAANGWLAIFQPAQHVFAASSNINCKSPACLIEQNDLSKTAFIQHLIHSINNC